MAVVCSLVGMGSIMSTVNIIGKIWNARSDLRRTGCYGLSMFNPSRKLANLPFRDCL